MREINLPTKKILLTWQQILQLISNAAFQNFEGSPYQVYLVCGKPGYNYFEVKNYFTESTHRFCNTAEELNKFFEEVEQ